MAPLSEPERRDFWEICEDRYQVRSTILASQLLVSRWHEQMATRAYFRWGERVDRLRAVRRSAKSRLFQRRLGSIRGVVSVTLDAEAIVVGMRFTRESSPAADNW